MRAQRLDERNRQLKDRARGVRGRGSEQLGAQAENQMPAGAERTHLYSGTHWRRRAS
jgi:hypothetical protein